MAESLLVAQGPIHILFARYLCIVLCSLHPLWSSVELDRHCNVIKIKE
jgi:hypothetical protein